MTTKTKTISKQELQRKILEAAEGENPDQIRITKISIKNGVADIGFDLAFIVPGHDGLDGSDPQEPIEVKHGLTLKGTNIIHPDFADAIAMLKSHYAILADFPESRQGGLILSPQEIEDNPELLEKIFVTGLTIGGDGDSEGAVMVGNRINYRGRTHNFVTPFEKYEDANDQYQFAIEWAHVIGHCQDEALLYIKGKVAPSAQKDLFEQDDDDDAPGFTIKNLNEPKDDDPDKDDQPF